MVKSTSMSTLMKMKKAKMIAQDPIWKRSLTLKMSKTVAKKIQVLIHCLIQPKLLLKQQARLKTTFTRLKV